MGFFRKSFNHGTETGSVSFSSTQGKEYKIARASDWPRAPYHKLTNRSNRLNTKFMKQLLRRHISVKGTDDVWLEQMMRHPSSYEKHSWDDKNAAESEPQSIVIWYEF